MMYIMKNTITSFSDSYHNDDSDNDHDDDEDEGKNEDFDDIHNVHMHCCLCIYWAQQAGFHLHQLYIIIM